MGDFRDAVGWSFRLGLRSLLLLIALGVSAVCPFAAGAYAQTAAWSDVTVVVFTGWEYQHVTVEAVPGEQSVVLVKPDGARKPISRSSIRAVLDQHGKDITHDVLGEGFHPAAPGTDSGAAVISSPATITPSPRNNPASRSDYGLISRERIRPGPRFRFALSGVGGFGVASGDWFQGLNNGVSFNLAGRVALTEMVFLGFNYRYQKLGVDDAFLRELEQEYGLSLSADVHLDEFYGVIGFTTQPGDLKSPFGYVEIGLGSVGHRFEFTASDGQQVATASSNLSKFGMLLAGGGVFPLSRGFGLCLEASMRITGQGNTGEYSGYDTSSTGVLFGFGGGIVFLLGR